MLKITDNPRYAAYVKSRRKPVEVVKQEDAQRFPGAKMLAFVRWNQRMIDRYREINPKAFFLNHLTDHAGYDEWLQKVVP